MSGPRVEPGLGRFFSVSWKQTFQGCEVRFALHDGNKNEMKLEEERFTLEISWCREKLSFCLHVERNAKRFASWFCFARRFAPCVSPSRKIQGSASLAASAWCRFAPLCFRAGKTGAASRGEFHRASLRTHLFHACLHLGRRVGFASWPRHARHV